MVESDHLADDPTDMRIDVPPQLPARKLCPRHLRMADEGTNLKLQQVCMRKRVLYWS